MSVQRPYLVGSVDRHPTQEIGIHLVAWVLLAGTRLPVQRLNTHALHQSADTPATNFDAGAVKLIAEHACSHKRPL